MRIEMEPASVNFTPLEARLSRIWRKRVGSPTIQAGTSGSMETSIITFFWAMLEVSMDEISSAIWRALNGIRSSWSWPASSFE